MKSISYLHMTQTILTIKILVVVLSYVQLFVTPRTAVPGILLARILECVAFPFSRGSSQPRDRARSPTLQVDS